jgi:BON domain
MIWLVQPLSHHPSHGDSDAPDRNYFQDQNVVVIKLAATAVGLRFNSEIYVTSIIRKESKVKVYGLVLAVLAAVSIDTAFADDAEDAKIRAEVRSQIDERLAAILSGHASAKDVEDAGIQAATLKQIKEMPSLGFYDIKVQSVNRDVYLYGFVKTAFDRAQAGDIASTVPGVKTVHNEISLAGCGFCSKP